MPNANPIFDPGQAFTGRATGGAVTGCRFVKVAATKPTTGEPLPIAHAGASDQPIGVAAADTAQNKVVAVYPGQVLKVCASAAINAGVRVQLAADGKVAPYSSGRPVGVAWESANNDGDLILVQIQL